MPKRGGFRGGRGYNHNYNHNHNQRTLYDEHDDRVRLPPPVVRISKNYFGQRRVSFKPSGIQTVGRQNDFKGRKAEMAIRSRFDGDEDMGENSGGNQHNFRQKSGGFQKRRGSPIPRSFRSKPKLTSGASGWFLVTIPFGYKYEKQHILKLLADKLSPNRFIPYYYKIEDNAANFYVDDVTTAELLLQANRQIEMGDGYTMMINVRHNLPQVKIDAALKEKMKLAMVKRYSPVTKAMDLTKFHSDPELLDVFCGLFRPAIMLEVMDIIAENIPDLEALNLHDNNLHILEHMRVMHTKLPHLKILHMGNNRITAPHTLDALKEIQIVDLVLQGNPIKNRFKEDSTYVSEVRKRFPKLMKLDGIDLPPEIGFDVSEISSSLPQAKASFLCDTNGADIVRQFLEQYFIIYDSDNRQPLLDAYHEDAMFSLTASHYHQSSYYKLTSYLVNSRNLLRIPHKNSTKYLKLGRLPVVSFLSELAGTQHDPQSFAVDLTLFTPQLILLTVTGIFKERGPKAEVDGVIRSFHRSLVIVPSGSGFCIKNDILHINNGTSSQIKVAFKGPIVAGPIIQPTAVVETPKVVTTPDDNTKVQMVQAMSQLSNMNFEWSRKCLEETNWDFDRAGLVFTELHRQNKIPQEAFVK